MPFDLKNLNPSTRFYLDDTKEEWIEMRLPSLADVKRIMAEAQLRRKVEYAPNPKTGQLEPVPDYTDEATYRFQELQVAKTITDWHLVTTDGEKIPCTDENKILLYNESPRFKRLYDKFFDTLSEERARLEESERKNS